MPKTLRETMEELRAGMRNLTADLDAIKKESAQVLAKKRECQSKLLECHKKAQEQREELAVAREEYNKAESKRIQAAVDISLSLRSWTLGNHALWDPKTPKPAPPDERQSRVLKELRCSSHSIVDGFLEDQECQELYETVRGIYTAGEMKDGITGGGRTGAGEKTDGFRDDKVKWMNDEQIEAGGDRCSPLKGYIRRIHEFFKSVCSELEYTKDRWLERGDAMMTCYPGNGAKYKRHSDNPNNNGRVLTSLIYLNPDWEPGHGGELKLMTGEKDFVLEPKMNRLVVFWSEDHDNFKTLHEVLPTCRERFAVTLWFIDSKIQLAAREVEGEAQATNEEDK